jgi:hypothetical protein
MLFLQNTHLYIQILQNMRSHFRHSGILTLLCSGADRAKASLEFRGTGKHHRVSLVCFSIPYHFLRLCFSQYHTLRHKADD